MTIFVGPNGLRAGWRFLLYVVILVGVNILLGDIEPPLFMALHVSPAWLEQLAPGPMTLGELNIGIPVIIATFVMAKLERRSILDYGFQPGSKASPLFWEGVALGVVSPAIVMVLMLLFNGMQIHGWGLHGAEWIAYPLGWLVVMLMVGFFEEATFRGYPLFTLAQGIRFWPAAVVMTLLFGAAHVSKPGENVVDISSVMLIGFFVCSTLWKTGSLWLAAGFHFAFDYMQFFVIGTRNGSAQPIGTLLNATFNGPAWVNGGPLGTEASYFIFPVTIGLFIYIALRFRTVAFKETP
jgi:membrane protease YdiL (CAAX protease family)